jgi:glycerol-3-phosphate acyltransferase PlsY
MGKKYAVITLIIDILKGVVALIIARLMQGLGVEPWAEYIAGVCVVLGHNFPVFFGFKGGKGVATSLGVVMMLDWKIGLAVLIIALAVMATTRYVSLGSIIAAVTFIVLQIAVMLISGNFNLIRFVCVMILGILLIVRHSANIVRLLNHTENKLGQKKKEEISK